MTEQRQPDGATKEGGLSRRDLLVRSALAASSAVVGIPLLAACGDTKTTTTVSTTPGQTVTTAGLASPHPGTVTGGLANAFVGFNPALSPQLASITVIRHVFEALMQYDLASKTWTPWLLAAEPERSAANTFTATIRDGATFHDGSPLTAVDVAWTFDYYKNPDTGSFFGTFLQTIDKVEGEGNTLTITVTEELPNFHFALSIPMIMPKAAFAAAGNDAFSAAPVGSGPYKFASQTPGQAVSLDRYAEYAGATPGKLDKIGLNYSVEDASRIVQLTSGQLDLIDGVPYRDIGTLAGDKIDAGATEGGRHSLVEMNQFKGPFKDEKVRQAFLHALDREKLIEAVFPGGNATVANSQLPPYHPYYVEPSAVYPYDPDKAKSLLAEAGHPDGFEFELMVSTIPWLTQLGTLMKEQLDAAGMKGTIRLTETEAGYGVVATKEYDVYVAYGNWYAIGRFADVPYRAFNYGAGRDGFYGKVEGRDDGYDKLVDAAFSETSEEAQIQAYLAAQELFSKSVFNNYIILWTKVTGAWQRYVTGYTPPEDDIPSLVNVSS